MTTERPFPEIGKIATAVVLGEHPVSVPAFHNMFRSFQDVDYYPQALEDFVVDQARVRALYDVVLFYNMHLDTPPVDPPPANEPGWWWRAKSRRALEELGETEQGIVILHHAWLAFPGWEFWSELVGTPHSDRTYAGFDELLRVISIGEMHIEVADTQHPITRGVSAWDMGKGEAWALGSIKPAEDCHTLLVTDHPKMRMKAIAWTRQFRKARVFFLQPGHDSDSFADPSFRTVLWRGIKWAAGRL
jgi:hypothetical protein